MSVVVMAIDDGTGICHASADGRISYGDQIETDTFEKLWYDERDIMLGGVGDLSIVSKAPHFLQKCTDLTHFCKLLSKFSSKRLMPCEASFLWYSKDDGLWYIEADGTRYQRRRFAAIGSGAPYALGVIEGGCDGLDSIPYWLVSKSVRLTHKLCSSVGPLYLSYEV